MTLPNLTCGPDGPELSALVQGYWRMLDWQRAPAEDLGFLEAHIALGVTTVDHADLYGDYEVELRFGEVLALNPSLRDELQLVTKCGIQLLSDKAPGRRVKHYDTSQEHILQSVNNSLTRLRTDYIDLLLIHRPDPLMNADEVAEAFVQLHDAGKVRAFGVSNFTPGQFALLEERLPFPLVTNQVEISPLNPAVLFDGTLDDLQRLNRRPMAWSCLAGGRLFEPQDEAGSRCRETMESIGEQLGGFGADQVALAWVRSLPSGPLPILGSGNIERVRAAVESLSIALTREQWFEILQAARGEEVP